MKKRNVIGACVMAAAIVVALPLGARNSLERLRSEAEGSYYYDNTGYALYDGLDEREATANNLITVARRYTDANPNLTGLIDDLDYAVRLTRGSYDDDSQEAQANRMMGDAAQALYEELKKTELSQEDQAYPDQLIAQMESEQDKINRSSYNQDAREFNQRLEAIPVKFLVPLTGVKPLATYDYE